MTEADRLAAAQSSSWRLPLPWHLCEFSSIRTDIPFGWYYYTGSTEGQELYIADVSFMDSLSFPFLSMPAIAWRWLLSWARLVCRKSDFGVQMIKMDFPLVTRTGWPVMLLTILFFTFIDIIIDPVALQGERWFLGRIYYYPEPGTLFGVPIANYIGWAIVGLISLA